MDSVQFREATKLWKQVSSEITSQPTYCESEINKRLLNIFQVGEFYYFILNLKEQKLDLLSKEIQDVLGYNPENKDLEFLLEKIHPEDFPWFLSYENKVTQFFQNLSPAQIPNYKVKYDYRIRKSDGTYIRILQQVITLDYDEHGRLSRTLGVHTDITELKPEGRPVLSIIGLNGEPSYLNIPIETETKKAPCILSAREIEILKMLASGKKSKEIANELFISKETVSTHRKKIIAKMHALNTPDLIIKATREGWI